MRVKKTEAVKWRWQDETVYITSSSAARDKCISLFRLLELLSPSFHRSSSFSFSLQKVRRECFWESMFRRKNLLPFKPEWQLYLTPT
jgi:hypothetical protein